MKILSSIVAVFFLTCSFAEPYLRSEFLSPPEARTKWGSQTFDAEKFRQAEKDPSTRAKMAADLVEKQKLRGFKRSEIIKILGRPDGYFFSDTIYAYIIQPYSESKKEAWQIVFIPDENLEKIKEIKIHKKCCYPEPSWAK